MIVVVSGATPPSGPGPPHSQGLQITHNDLPQLVGLLWTSDKLVAQTLPDNTQHSQETNIHAPGGIRTHKFQLANGLRSRGHWDRLSMITRSNFSVREYNLHATNAQREIKLHVFLTFEVVVSWTPLPSYSRRERPQHSQGESLCGLESGLERCEGGKNWCNDQNLISIVLFMAVVVVVSIIAYFRYIDIIIIIIIIIRHVRKL